jgi:hypothetical protein
MVVELDPTDTDVPLGIFFLEFVFVQSRVVLVEEVSQPDWKA